MSGGESFSGDPIEIGEIAAPPFVRLPDPRGIFAQRSARFKALADNHQLGPYLRFLSDISAIQYGIQRDLPEPSMPDAESLKQAQAHAMPPLDRNTVIVAGDAALEETFDRLFTIASTFAMPDAARAGLAQASTADTAAREAMVRAVLSDSYPAAALASHLFVAAALQVDFARRASRLDPESLQRIGTGVCPSCGAPPVASQIVGWEGAHGTRFCSCSLCGTLWHVVRITCVTCESTAGISYEELQGGDTNVKAETCSKCNSYVKILHQHIDTKLDPVADDVASLGLDLLLRETNFRRAAVNPFLLGY